MREFRYILSALGVSMRPCLEASGWQPLPATQWQPTVNFNKKPSCTGLNGLERRLLWPAFFWQVKAEFDAASSASRVSVLWPSRADLAGGLQLSKYKGRPLQEGTLPIQHLQHSVYHGIIRQ